MAKDDKPKKDDKPEPAKKIKVESYSHLLRLIAEKIGDRQFDHRHLLALADEIE